MAPIHQWPLAILRRWLVLPAVGIVCLRVGMAVGVTQAGRSCPSIPSDPP